MHEDNPRTGVVRDHAAIGQVGHPPLRAVPGRGGPGRGGPGAASADRAGRAALPP